MTVGDRSEALQLSATSWSSTLPTSGLASAAARTALALGAGDLRERRTGHSLGAALATLAVSRLEGLPRASLHVYGSPRAGDRAFCERVSRHAPGRVFRFVNSKDVVTLVPSRSWGFAHVEKEHYIDSRFPYLLYAHHFGSPSPS